MALTAKQVQGIAVGEWKSDGGARGAGMLAFRRPTSGEVLAYFRYTLPTGKRDALPIGKYDQGGRDGYTLAELRDKAGELSRLYQSGAHNLRAHFESQRAEQEATAKSEQAEREAQERAQHAAERFTLGNLCNDYAQHLQERGKLESARQARSLFKVWVESDASFATTQARHVTPHQIAAAIRKPREADKERTAGILRAYLLAAFNAARRAPFDSKMPSGLIAYQVESNPCEIIPAIPVSAGNRTLTADELKAYIAQLGDSVTDKTLKVCLYAGGQRISQLLRATVSDFDNNSLRLWDGKGRRREAREHMLPLAPIAAGIITELVAVAKAAEDKRAEQEGRDARYGTLPIFSAYAGSPLVATSIGRRIHEISIALKGEPFDARDIRRTVETMMAGMGISKDLRAQLLSHGLGGVQDAHYDRHGYTDEKRAALQAWEARLEQIATGKAQQTNIINLHAA